MNDIKLTIAVPVYNVEKYLNRCLDSLINQEYEKKEILLIDDGSTDRSGIICDEYEKKYSFIRVIHQKNRGLAAVRNRCIAEARGEFISFIDSDDYVLDGLYSHVMEMQKERNADIVCFGVVNIYENVDRLNNVVIDNKNEVIIELSVQEAIDEMLLPNHVDVITCNKIIRKELYKGIAYPEGKLYEDMFTNYKVISKSNIILSTNYKYYVYCHRSNSIGGMRFNPKTMDLAKAVEEVYYFGEKFCNKRKYIYVGRAFWHIAVSNIMIKSQKVDRQYIRKVQLLIRKYKSKVILNDYLSVMRKIQMLLFAYIFPLYKIIYLKYIEKHR